MGNPQNGWLHFGFHVKPKTGHPKQSWLLFECVCTSQGWMQSEEFTRDLTSTKTRYIDCLIAVRSSSQILKFGLLLMQNILTLPRNPHQKRHPVLVSAPRQVTETEVPSFHLEGCGKSAQTHCMKSKTDLCAYMYIYIYIHIYNIYIYCPALFPPPPHGVTPKPPAAPEPTVRAPPTRNNPKLPNEP